MVESVESGEKQRQTQAPNRTEVWSRSQAKRDEAMSGPRFEQTMMHMQVSFCLCMGRRLRGWKREQEKQLGSVLSIDEGNLALFFNGILSNLDFTASTRSRYIPHPQTTRTMDEKPGRVL